MSLTKVSYSMITGAPVNVLDYGASTSASAAANTTAIQAAIDAAPDGSTILIPPGTYNVIYGSLNFTRRQSLTITSGSTRDSTILQANATAATSSTPLIDVVGCFQMLFIGIQFTGVSSSGIGVYIHRPITGADKVSTGINFNNCSFSYFSVGAQIGRLDLVESNNEDMHFNTCEWQFCTIGYRQYYQNVLQNSITDGYLHNNGRDVHLGGNGYQTGSLLMTNANFSTTAGSNIYFELPCYLEVDQCRSEFAAQFISSSTAFRSTAFPMFILIGVTIIAQTSAVLPMIDCRTMGFVAIGCQFGQYTDTPAFINLSTYQQKATLIGCSFNVPVTYGINTNTWTGTIYTLGGNDGIGQFLLSGCNEWSTSLSGYTPVADVTLISTAGGYSISTATPDVRGATTWLVNNTTAPLTITAFTALQNQKFTLVNYYQSTQTTTIKNNTTIKTITGADTVLVSGMTFVYLSGVSYQV